MRHLRLTIGAVRLVINVLIGLFLVACWFPLAGPARRLALVRWWARGVLRICGVQLIVRGTPLTGGHVLVSNHISWMDIYAINAVAVARFVAKAEIRSWPLFGWLAARTGTLFLERGRRHAVHRANATIATALRAGDRIGIFPEGTTGDGGTVLRFHANLIEAAIETNAPVQPLALCYRTAAGEPTQAPAFVGEMTLIESIASTLAAAPLRVELNYLPAIAVAGLTRHEVAELARDAIVASRASRAAGAAGTPPETAPDPRAAPR